MSDTHTATARNRSPERAEFLADVIIGAVEGGTGYWAQASGYHWSDDQPATTRVVLIDMENDGDDARTLLDIDTIAGALAKIRRGEVSMSPRLLDTILHADRTNDGGDIDADAADVIAQVACFGQIVYG